MTSTQDWFSLNYTSGYFMQECFFFLNDKVHIPFDFPKVMHENIYKHPLLVWSFVFSMWSSIDVYVYIFSFIAFRYVIYSFGCRKRNSVLTIATSWF